MKFKDAYKNANDSVHVRADLLEEMKYKQAKAQTETPNKREKRRAWWVAIPTSVTAVAVACIAVFIGLRAGQSKSAQSEPVADSAAFDLTANAEETGTGEAVYMEAGMSLKTYDTYQMLAEQIENRGGFRFSEGSFVAETDSMIAPGMAEEPTEAEPDMPVSIDTELTVNDAEKREDGTVSEYGTNVQVAGVDEADIVKTDGTWIYCLNQTNNRLYIVSADGKNSRISASAKLRETKEDSSESIIYSEMILANDRLFVIGTIYDWGSTDSNGETTFIEIYRLGDRTSLKKTDTLKQKGNYRTARLIGDTLVVVSNSYPWYRVYTEDMVSVWCPSVVDGNEKTLLEPGEIYVNEDSRGSGYVMITTIDTKNGKKFDSHKAVFSGSNVVYCNETHLIIASEEWENERSEEQTDSEGKHFVKDISRAYTSLCLFEIKDGKINPIGTQKIEGALLNQFSIDEFNGVYRLVVTRDGNEETIWTDGIDTYENKQIRDCALYVLDAKLNLIGKLENLAQDETVQSVRFMGDVAYFVTFRQVDPLFAVDLSDPENPTMLSALKIPGFSAYLHPFGEGRLLGIGFSADEKTGMTDGVKLTLFDISDPGDVKVLQTKKVRASYTAVQYNHKAVFADAKSGIAAFPADDKYFVFEVHDDGINDRGAIDVGEMYYWDDGARGIAIDESFYVVTSEAIVVLSFDTMKKLTEVKF